MRSRIYIFVIALIGFFSSSYGQKTVVELSTDKSEFTAVVVSETGDAGLTIIYGKIIEVSCLFSIGNVHIKYGMKSHFLNNKDTDPFRSDPNGNYIIEIRSYRDNMGLSFNYNVSDSYADFFVLVPPEWRGKRIKLDIGLKLKFTGGLDCF
jgi:hypothetical protein